LKDKEVYKNPIFQALLKELPSPEVIVSDWKLSFPISKSFIDKDRKIIAGYASVEVIDSQDELIPLPVLKEAWEHFKANKDFYFGSLMHSNVPVIKILDSFKDSEGTMWKSGVDENGLFIVGEIRQDIQKGVQTWELIEKGKLTGFSIGGEALESSKVCEGKCFTRIEKMELHEIAVVDKPANEPSVFTIVKRKIEKEEIKLGMELSIDEIKYKIKDLIKEREDLSRKVSPLPWEEKLAEDEKPKVLASIEALDKELGKYRDTLGLKLADQTLLAKALKEKSILDKTLRELHKMTWEECISEAEANPDVNDPEALCGWLRAYGPNAKKQEGKPKTDEERAMSHFNITSEKWNTLTDKEKQDYIGKLPERGTAIGKPFAGYKDFDACVAANSDKGDPEAYCATIERQVEGKVDKCECPVDKVINKETFSKLEKGIKLISKRNDITRRKKKIDRE